MLVPCFDFGSISDFMDPKKGAVGRRVPEQNPSALKRAYPGLILGLSRIALIDSRGPHSFP